MSTERRNWTREELLLAINLYCRIPFGRIHNKNPEIIDLASLLNRTPSSVSYKLANFASLDETIERKGANHISKLDKDTWNEFQNNWEPLIIESEILKSSKNAEKTTYPKLPLGRETVREVKSRINQYFFRDAVLSNYDYKCCITGINVSQLLVASHIIPWSVNEKERLNPKNGLCLNALHDKAFDSGLISIDANCKILISQKLKSQQGMGNIEYYFGVYEGLQITAPKKFWPDEEFLIYHRKHIFAA